MMNSELYKLGEEVFLMFKENGFTTDIQDGKIVYVKNGYKIKTECINPKHKDEQNKGSEVHS